ncbi:hypothetical protein [Moorena producens]|uniref:hypothetical protein n=1 Tax=Moorena producens TaxID=1155739 RepID=UPI003C763A75
MGEAPSCRGSRHYSLLPKIHRLKYLMGLIHTIGIAPQLIVKSNYRRGQRKIL